MTSRLLLALALCLAACGPSHIAKYTPKHRDYEVPQANASDDRGVAPGSLWRDGRPASQLFTDARALREHDLVVIKVEEVADARRTADTDVSRSSKMQAAVTAFLSNINKNIDVTTDTAFTGSGSTARTEKLTATVPAVVRKVLPNGNLFVEGHRVVLVNSEEHHFYISGVVRPIDIDGENSVKSSMVADAEIEFTGQGVVSDSQRQGWLNRFFGYFWPF